MNVTTSVCQVLNQKNIIALTPEERVAIFDWLFLEEVPTPNKMKSTAGTESVSAKDDQVEIQLLKNNPRKKSSLVSCHQE